MREHIALEKMTKHEIKCGTCHVSPQHSVVPKAGEEYGSTPLPSVLSIKGEVFLFYFIFLTS